MIIYLASPYTGTGDEQLMRVAEVAFVTRRLMVEKPEHSYYSPVVHGHFINTVPEAHRKTVPQVSYDYWITHGLTMLQQSDEMWVVMLDGHEQSRGINLEAGEADKMKIPVRMLEPETLEVFTHVRNTG